MADPFTFDPKDYEVDVQQPPGSDDPPPPPPQEDDGLLATPPAQAAQTDPAAPAASPQAPAGNGMQFDRSEYFDTTEQREGHVPGTEQPDPGILDNIKAAALGFAEDWTYQWGDDLAVAAAANIHSYLDGKEPRYKGYRGFYDWMQQRVVKNSDPGWYEWGGLAGAILAPGSRFLSPIGFLGRPSTAIFRAARKIPQLRRAAPFLRELPGAGTTMGIYGLGEADPVGNDWEDTKQKIGDMQWPWQTLAAGASPVALNWAMKKIGKYWRRFKESAPEIKTRIYAAMGGMTEEMAEKILKNPEGIDPLTVKTAEAFSYRTAEAVNELRYSLGKEYDRIFGLLDDEPTIPIEDFRLKIEKTLNQLRNKSYFKDGQIDSQVTDFTKILHNGLDQIEKRNGVDGKISTFAARDMLSLFTKETAAFKFGGDKARPHDAIKAVSDFYRSFRRFTHLKIEQQLIKNPDQEQAKKTFALYRKLKTRVWMGERLYYDMAAHMRLKVPQLKPFPTHTGARPVLDEATKAKAKAKANLVPEPLATTARLGGFPLKGEKDKAIIQLEQLDQILGLKGKDSLARELEYVRIGHRTQRGVTNGSRNTNAFAITGGSVGGLIGSGADALMKTSPHLTVAGGLVGTGAGAVAGFLVDQHGRRWAKNAIVKLGKGAGYKYEGYPYKTAPSILNRLHELGKTTTDKIMEHIKGNRYAAAVNLMVNGSDEQTGYDREDRVRFSQPIDPGPWPPQ